MNFVNIVSDELRVSTRPSDRCVTVQKQGTGQWIYKIRNCDNNFKYVCIEGVYNSVVVAFVKSYHRTVLSSYNRIIVQSHYRTIALSNSCIVLKLHHQTFASSYNRIIKHLHRRTIASSYSCIVVQSYHRTAASWYNYNIVH